MADVPVDERGIPTELDEHGTAALHCPMKPCELCRGDSNVVNTKTGHRLSSWEWCQEMDTCGATVNWELIAERGRS